MNISLITILITPFVGGLLAYLGGKINSTLRYAFALSFSATFILELFIYRNLKIDFLVLTKTYGSQQILQINPLSWLFSIILGITTLAAIALSINERHLFSNVHAMTLMFLEGVVFGFLSSGDMLTLFAFFCAFIFLAYVLLIEIGHSFSLKFLDIHFVGSFLFLFLLLLLFKNANNFIFINIKSSMPAFANKIVLLILIIFTLWAFAETNLFPFNLIRHKLYSKIPASSRLFLTNAVKNMGLYALIIFFYSLTGQTAQSMYALKIIGLLGALTFVSSSLMPLFNADSAEAINHLLFGETGISLIGVSLINSYGFASALLIIINQALWMGLFLFAESGGSIKVKFINKLHIDRIGFVLSILMLMGLPLTLQFTSRYLLFTALLDKGELFFISLIVLGGVAEIVSLCKLLNIAIIKETNGENPHSYILLIPMLTISIFMIVLGAFPYISLNVIKKIDQMLNPYHMEIQFSTLKALNSLQARIILIIASSGILLGVVSFYLIPLLKKKLPGKITFPISNAFSKLNVQAKLIINKITAAISPIKTVPHAINKAFDAFKSNLPIMQGKIKTIMSYFLLALALILVALLIMTKG